MLQQQSIVFRPALPAAKKAAISRIRMSNAIKVDKFNISSAFFCIPPLQGLRRASMHR
jgi:hypothetical protein